MATAPAPEGQPGPALEEAGARAGAPHEGADVRPAGAGAAPERPARGLRVWVLAKSDTQDTLWTGWPPWDSHMSPRLSSSTLRRSSRSPTGMVIKPGLKMKSCPKRKILQRTWNSSGR